LYQTVYQNGRLDGRVGLDFERGRVTLDELLKLVEGSTVDDWHKMNIHTVYGWEFGQKNQQNYLEPKLHNYVAVYKPDVDVTLAFDAPVNDPFNEPWTDKFADKHAVSVAVWLRYRGVVVYERGFGNLGDLRGINPHFL
jgi:hypothetical protein